MTGWGKELDSSVERLAEKELPATSELDGTGRLTRLAKYYLPSIFSYLRS